MPPPRTLLAAAFSLGLLAACRNPVPAPRPTSLGDSPDPRREALREAALSFERRSDPGRLREAVRAFRRAAELGATPDLLVALARAEHLLAWTSPEVERAAIFEQGARHAGAALERAGAGPCGEGAGPSQVAALYWRAECLDGWSRSVGLVAGSAARKEALCLARRAAELDAGFFFAGPLRLSGRLLAQLPALSGGDLARSREAFDRALSLAPEFLGTRVDLAGSWAVKAQDRAAFEQSLRQVLDADPGDRPEIAPENDLARRRAAELLARVRDLF